jgi:hypothetical protein
LAVDRWQPRWRVPGRRIKRRNGIHWDYAAALNAPPP